MTNVRFAPSATVSPAPIRSLHPSLRLDELLQYPLRRYKKGETIYAPGDEADRVFFLVEGKVKISILHAEEKEITKAIFGPNEIFGENAIAGEQTRRDYATALENTIVRWLSARDMLLLLQRNQDLTLFMMNLMTSRQVDIERRLESLVFRDSRSRIVECIVHLTTRKGQRVGYEWMLHSPVTHQEIANMTATSRQTVTTTLNDLRAAKLLVFNRKRLLIRDLEKLRAEIRA